jgi:hypothetical protein
VRLILALVNGVALTCDSDDIADAHVCTPIDVHDVSRPEDTAIRRELGDQHVHQYIRLKPGRRAVWIREEELNHG